MGRKRKSVPVRLDESKRHFQSWNMYDLNTDVHIVSENDDQFLKEQESVSGSKQMCENGISKQTTVGYYHTIQEKLINECDFYLTVKRQLSVHESKSLYCVIGSFKVHLQAPFQDHASSSTTCIPKTFPGSSEFWLYVSPSPGKHLVYFEWDVNSESGNLPESPGLKTVQCYQAGCSLSYTCLEGLQCRAFVLQMGCYSASTGEMEVKIHINDSALTKLQFSSEGFRTIRGKNFKKVNSSLQLLMASLHGFTLPDYENCTFTKKHDIDELYAEIKARHKEENFSIQVNVQSERLRPRLREYQKAAVRWMLLREHTTNSHKNSDSGRLHCLYEDFCGPDGHELYYNKHGGILVRDKPVQAQSPPGGILADEMGLGKTVEVLALILAHPRGSVPPIEPLPIVTPDEEDEDDKDCIEEQNISVSESQLVRVSTEKLVGHQAVDSTSTVKIDRNTLSMNDRTTPCDQDGEFQVPSEDLGGNVSPELATLDHQYCLRGKSQMGITMETSDNIDTVDVGGEDAEDMFSEQPKMVLTGRKGRSKQNAVKGKNVKSGGKKTIVSSEALSLPVCGEEPWRLPPDGPPVGQSEGGLVVPGGATAREPPNKGMGSRRKLSPKMADRQAAVFVTKGDAKQKAYLECICGQDDHGNDDENERLRVQCNTCGLWQHPECVHYDLKDPYRGVYQCPHCHVLSPPVPSRATLIISPNSICHQWVEEIHKHIRNESLKVLVYTGVHKHGFLQPQYLARHDIVITTYETLQKEINYVDLPHSNSDNGRRFRRPKRFMAVPSPMIAVEWWRICLDEAQMVECTTTKTAEMALRLTAVNRWCVTGTPIQKGLQDLYGLLLFLGVDPYWVYTWWNCLLYEPYCHGDKEHLYRVISSILWRTCKKDVLEEICLPMQSEEVHWLSFSPVEEHFYNLQFSLCARDALAKLSKFPAGTLKLKSLDRYTLHDLLAPLARLRQACCHPQAVRGSFLPICKSTMTMEELLTSLIKKARQECEEAHRQLVAATNGLAGVFIVNEMYVEAVEQYREVLRSVVEQEGQFRTDPLQQLHTLHNLGEVLVLKPAGVDPTLRDDKLGEEAAELRKQYLLKAATFVNQAEETWGQIQHSLTQLTKEIRGGEEWWAELLQWIIYIGIDGLLIERLKDDKADNNRLATQSIIYRFRDATGLEYILSGQIEQLDASHQTLVDALYRLQGPPSLELIHQTVECCLRPVDQILKSCPFCKTEKLFEEYESRLFSFTEKGVSEVGGPDGENLLQTGTSRQGTWADSEVEHALKTIISFTKGYGADRDVLRYGATHMKILEAFKKEFKCIRTLWIELRAQVSTYDELDMATTRLRLRLPDEPIPDPPQPNIINPEEYDTQKLKLHSDKILGQTQLRRKKSQLFYLINLAKSQTGLEGGENPELCPVCQNKLATKWSVLTCGHCYCLDCVRILVDQYSFGGHHHRLRCPMCRQMTSHKDISYVSTATKQADEETPIKGDHSTKVEGVLRCVMKILHRDPRSKILIFSVWQNVLNILAGALKDNSILFCSHTAQKNIQSNLWNFKNRDEIPVLLIPVHSGSNGLNLIEANHVLLVEPILNSGQELQAIGRVHRIGQTKATFVHRFLVKATIEERLHHLLATAATKFISSNDADDTPFTINDVQALFRESLPEIHDDTDYAAVGTGVDPTASTVETRGETPTGTGCSRLLSSNDLS